MRTVINLLGLAWKQMVRHRMRSFLTVTGAASGMFLLTTVESMQRSVARATGVSAEDTTLVVYRQNRFCPSASRLPEHYTREIQAIPGVRGVIPVKIVVNNCGASLDVITFRGVPEDDLLRFAPEIRLVAGGMEEWRNRDDAALLGEVFARRRGLSPGDRFDAAGVTVTVAGILQSPFLQDNNVAYVKLPFLQRAAKTGVGVVTQFNVRVHSHADLDPVARAIDEQFRTAPEPTDTRPEKAFFAETAGEMVALIGFTRWLGLGAVLAVAALVANALLLAVSSRVKEHAVLRTLGYPGRAIAWLVVSEGSLLGLAGGVVGVGSAAAFLRWQSWTMGNEGQTLAIEPDRVVVGTAIALALALGAVASAWPALRAVSQPIAGNLRS
jgi:putative ABC transport system permease protein